MSDQKVYVIGSAPDCDIVVDEPHVSGHHCKLHFDRGGFLLEDLQSTNGTYVNGVRISEATIITKGEKVTLGRKSPMPWPGSNDVASGSAPPPPASPPKSTPEPKSAEPKAPPPKPVPADPPAPAKPVPQPVPMSSAAQAPSETVSTPPPASAGKLPDVPKPASVKSVPPLPDEAPVAPPKQPPAAKPLPAAPKASPKPPTPKAPAAKSLPEAPTAAPPKGAPAAKSNTPPEIKQRPPASPARPSPRFTDPFALDPDGNPKKGNTMLLVGAGVAVAACVGLLIWAFSGNGPDVDPPPKPGEGTNTTPGDGGSPGDGSGTPVVRDKDDSENGGRSDGTPAATNPRDAVVWLGFELQDKIYRYASGFAIAPDRVVTSASHESWIRDALNDEDIVVLAGNERESVRVSKFEAIAIPGDEHGMLVVNIPELAGLVTLKPGSAQPAVDAPIDILTWGEWDSGNVPEVVVEKSTVQSTSSGSGFTPGFSETERKFQGAAVLSKGELVGMFNVSNGSPIVQPIPGQLR